MTEIKNFEEEVKYCIDPFKKHRNKVESELVSLTQESINYLLNVLKMKFSLENKMCNVCSIKLDSEILKYNESLEVASISASDIANPSDVTDSPQTITESTSVEVTQSSSTSEFESDSQKKRKIEDILDIFIMPPFKREKLSNERTVEKGLQIVQSIAGQVSDAFRQAHAVELPKCSNIRLMLNESCWFKNIIANIQEKLSPLQQLLMKRFPY